MKGFHTNGKGLVKPLLRSAGVRNFAKLLSANVVAQVIGLVVYPILTRMYAPDDFGLLNLFLSISGVLVILATAEYQYAIVLPKDDRQARAVVHVGLIVLTGVVALTAVSVAFSVPIARVFKSPDLVRYYWLMPVMVLVLGLWNLLNYWYIRREAYARISGYQMSQSVLAAGSKIGLGAGGFLRGGLIVSMVVAPLMSLIISVSLAWKKHIRPLLGGVDKAMCREVARTYRNFPVYSLPRSFVNMLAGQLPVLLLTPAFGAREVGFWSMAILLGFSPVSMLTRAMYQSLYQTITVRVNDSVAIGGTFRRFTMMTLAAVVPTFAVLYWFLPQLAQWFLGEEWSTSGEYIRWMLPWLCVNMLTASTGFLADIFFKQRIGLLFEVLMAVLRTLGVVAGLLANSFVVAVAGYSIGSAVAVLAQYVWLMTLVRRYDRSLQTGGA